MQLNYKMFGEGNPVVILHGMFGTLDNWQTIAKQLSRNFMVFIVDLRNHGRSPHSDEFNYSIMVEDLREFMESHWLYKASVVGHSMGGKVAMEFATEYPDMVESLVIADIAPKAYTGNHQNIFDALFGLDLKNLASRKEADKYLKSRVDNYGIRQFILKNLYLNKETRKYTWRMNLEVIHRAYTHILGKSNFAEPFEGSVLFIKGSESAYIEVDEFESYKAYFPKAELQTIEDAGHWVHSEQPDKFLEILNSFLLNQS
jgi:esterase